MSSGRGLAIFQTSLTGGFRTFLTSGTLNLTAMMDDSDSDGVGTVQMMTGFSRTVRSMTRIPRTGSSHGRRRGRSHPGRNILRKLDLP